MGRAINKAPFLSTQTQRTPAMLPLTLLSLPTTATVTAAAFTIATATATAIATAGATVAATATVTNGYTAYSNSRQDGDDSGDRQAAGGGTAPEHLHRLDGHHRRLGAPRGGP